MIVLPNTPPLPISVALLTDSSLSAQISLKRLSVSNNPQSHSECAKFVVDLEDYIENVFTLLVEETGKDVAAATGLAAKTLLYHGPAPWRNVAFKKKTSLLLNKAKAEWTLAADICISLISAALMYTKLGADLINSLIETASQDVEPKWKLVADHYKKALGLLSFAAKFASGVPADLPQINPILIAALEKVCHIGIQLSILCKSLWINRISFEHHESFLSSNNGVLCRVAIWIMNEISIVQNMFKELDALTKDGLIGLDCDGWNEYCEVFCRYVTAYSGLFLSIEYYQKGELGLAIGLIHFSLLSLQEKLLLRFDESKSYKKLKNRLVGKRNDNFVANLHSLTALKIDKSVFRDSAGIVLNDLTYLYDQLVYLRLKFTKENDNLQFEAVLDWKDVRSDTRWPMGTRIPTSGVTEYIPEALAEKKNGLNPNFKGQYF